MTKYEFLQTCTIDDFAAFVTSLIENTEYRILGMLSQNGIDASIVNLSFELQCLQNKAMLLAEYKPTEAEDDT